MSVQTVTQFFSFSYEKVNKHSKQDWASPATHCNISFLQAREWHAQARGVKESSQFDCVLRAQLCLEKWE